MSLWQATRVNKEAHQSVTSSVNLSKWERGDTDRLPQSEQGSPQVFYFKCKVNLSKWDTDRLPQSEQGSPPVCYFKCKFEADLDSNKILLFLVFLLELFSIKDHALDVFSLKTDKKSQLEVDRPTWVKSKTLLSQFKSTIWANENFLQSQRHCSDIYPRF